MKENTRELQNSLYEPVIQRRVIIGKISELTIMRRDPGLKKESKLYILGRINSLESQLKKVEQEIINIGKRSME